jgi:hypothetical protein
VGETTRPLYERLLTPIGAGVIAGTFDHDCQDDDIVDVIGGQKCRVCDCFVDDPHV